MSPTDAKRGAKRRKSKRGGGSSSCTLSVQAGTPGGDSVPRTADTPVSSVGLLSAGIPGGVAGLNGEHHHSVSTDNRTTPSVTGVISHPQSAPPNSISLISISTVSVLSNQYSQLPSICTISQ
ncbi:protein FAM193A isoform X1 [Arapaima gigas]